MASNTGTLVYNETMSKLINCLHLFECPVNWSKYSLLMSLSYTLPLQIANQQFVLQLHDGYGEPGIDNTGRKGVSFL